MSFATITDLENVLGRELPENDPAALFALDSATAMVRAIVYQYIEEVEDDVIVLDGTGTRVLLLPETPVSDVSLVEIDGEELDDDEYQWSADGYVRKLNGTWTTDLRSIEVTYSHGYATIPALIVSITAKLAARMLDTPISVRQEAIGAYSATYTAATLQADELVLLDAYKRS